MTRATRWIAAVAALLLGACGDAGPLPEPPAGYDFAYATPACGPTDGPAVRVYLSAQESRSLPPAGPWLELDVWRSPASLPGTNIEWSGSSNLGWAGRCTGVGQCDAAFEVRMKFRSFAADSTLSGTLDLRFADGSRVAGGFSAVWYSATPLCG